MVGIQLRSGYRWEVFRLTGITEHPEGYTCDWGDDLCQVSFGRVLPSRPGRLIENRRSYEDYNTRNEYSQRGLIPHPANHCHFLCSEEQRFTNSDLHCIITLCSIYLSVSIRTTPICHAEFEAFTVLAFYTRSDLSRNYTSV